MHIDTHKMVAAGFLPVALLATIVAFGEGPVVDAVVITTATSAQPQLDDTPALLLLELHFD